MYILDFNQKAACDWSGNHQKQDHEADPHQEGSHTVCWYRRVQ